MSQADRSAAGPVPRRLSPSHRDHPRHRSSVMTRHRPARGGATRELLRGRAPPEGARLAAPAAPGRCTATRWRSHSERRRRLTRCPRRAAPTTEDGRPRAGASGRRSSATPGHHERAEAEYPDRPQQPFAEERQERAGHQQSDGDRDQRSSRPAARRVLLLDGRRALVEAPAQDQTDEEHERGHDDHTRCTSSRSWSAPWLRRTYPDVGATSSRRSGHASPEPSRAQASTRPTSCPGGRTRPVWLDRFFFLWSMGAEAILGGSGVL
jgi:hypothetical protein